MENQIVQLTIIWLIICCKTVSVVCNSHPHIVYILADDLGWNDLSFHGSDQIPTPNIDALAYSGVILNRHYALPSCTPSRASLMSAKYPIHTGQHVPGLPSQRTALDLSIKIMPQYLKDYGYSTHIIGKWHLGFYRKEFTPLERGFDSHFGYWTGALSYYDHTNEDFTHSGPNGTNLCGHDMRRNFTSAYDVLGEYATDLFTKEAVKVIENHDTNKPLFLYLPHLAAHAGNQGKRLEAPIEEVKKFMYIANPNRRSYAAMVSKLDESVGAVMTALADKDMLRNSIVVFVSDNGPPNDGVYQNWGSSYPFRGQKQTLWEGGVRVPALIWSPLIQKSSRVYNGLMHITDWLPTFLTVIGKEDISSEKFDGVSQWHAISNDYTSPRTNLIIEIYDKKNMSSLIYKQFKYIKGARGDQPPKYDEYLNFNTIFSPSAPSYNTSSITSSKTWFALNSVVDYSNIILKMKNLREESEISCGQFSEYNSNIHCEANPCLFNIIKDPCEQHNIATDLPVLTHYLEQLVEDLKQGQFPEEPFITDLQANPDLHNGSWTYWEK